MKKLMIALAAMTGAVATPALAAEKVAVTFTQPDGGVTTNAYSGVVKVRVSGTGFSLGNQTNDAFYLYDGASSSRDGSYYQLTFGTSALTPVNPAQNAANFIVGGVPAYAANHVYTFLLNTGATTPTTLHFGVGDGNFGDNGGSFSVLVAGVPEPATWALMILGFGAVGGAMRRRRGTSGALRLA